jgi:hypothetical protein
MMVHVRSIQRCSTAHESARRCVTNGLLGDWLRIGISRASRFIPFYTIRALCRYLLKGNFKSWGTLLFPFVRAHPGECQCQLQVCHQSRDLSKADDHF